MTFEVTSPETSDSGPFTYERQLGLQESPFTLTANPRFLFESRSHGVALAQIHEALRRHEPMIVITGEAGTGKTLVGRVLTQEKNADLLVATISTPPETADDVLRIILDELGVMPRDSRRASEISRFEMQRTLEQFLVSLAALNASAVVVVDEAHRLNDGTLEQLRSLSNLETDHRKLLQIVLLAEPEFEARLEGPALAPLRQRITRLHALGPLTPKEVAPYIEKRLSVARGAEPLMTWPFTNDGIEAITALSRGVPRVINVLCDRALEIGCAWGVTRADRRVVLAAAKHLHLDIPVRLTLRSQARPLSIAAAILVILGVSGWLILDRTASPRAAQASRPVSAAPAPVASAGDSAAPKMPTAAPNAMPKPPAASAPPAAAVTTSNATTTPTTGDFDVLAASFRTRDRAEQVAQDVGRGGLPVRIRTTTAGWYQVVIGPYKTRDEAKTVRDGLGQTAFADATIIAVSTDATSKPPTATAAAASVPASTAPSARGATERGTPAANVSSLAVAPKPAASTGTSPAPSAGTPTSRPPAADARPATLDAAVRRAEALAQVPDVRGLMQLRSSVASSPEAAANPSAELNAALSRIDALLDIARQKQLEIDSRQLRQNRGTPR